MTFHLEQHHGTEHQRHPCQHLVGNTKQRPQSVNAAQRIDHALMEEVAPRQYAQRCCQQVSRQ
ncbi:Uncharacterised protein [Shigella sonnei]|nr:Uncharacterised protein [Shigella sonnei]